MEAERPRRGGELSKNGESCAKKYEEQSLPFPAFSLTTHYCVGLHRPPAWIKVRKKRYLTSNTLIGEHGIHGPMGDTTVDNIIIITIIILHLYSAITSDVQ